MTRSLGRLTLVQRILTAVEALALAAGAICVLDRQWMYAAITFTFLVAVYVLLDRRIERRVAEVSLEVAAGQGRSSTI